MFNEIKGFDFEIDFNPPETQKSEGNNQSEKSKSRRRSVECYELSTKYEYRRAFSETQLLDVLPKQVEEGRTYNCLSNGDVDALSYLKYIIRQQNITHLICSTWCMAAEDIVQLFEWVETSKIKRMDIYVGEIFPNSYKVEFNMLKKLYEKHPIGRWACFRNHSKIFAGYGDKFHFGIQTSANINTNPRCENGCITIEKGIYEFYKQFFDGIICIIKRENDK